MFNLQIQDVHYKLYAKDHKSNKNLKVLNFEMYLMKSSSLHACHALNV